jgi:hypothetical protein
MSKEQLTGLGLMEAKVLAGKLSRETSKVQYILVDAEGDCSVSTVADKSAYCAFKGGSEVALGSDFLAAETEATPKKSKKSSKKVAEVDELEELFETEPKQTSSTKTKTKKVMETKTKKSAKKAAPKKAAKKVAPKKGAVKKVVAASTLAELKCNSFLEAVKQARKEGLKKARVIIKGKEYGLRSSSGWAVVRSIVELGKDGFIMDVQGVGFYVYNKADHKELFGKIFASGTYKNIGIYSQSTLPKWHEEYFTAAK